MAPLPRLGVVVLNWNGRAHLERLLPTLRASQGANAFVVVADNGSTDGSLEWLASAHPDVQVVDNGTNLRFAAGNNRGVAAALTAGAELVLILNNDTTVAPDALAHLSAAFREDPQLGIVGPRICYLARPNRIWYGGGQFAATWGWVAHRALRRGVAAGADPAGPTTWVTGCAMAVRADVWTALSGLDESFYIYAEDVDFCLRARAAGWGVGYRPAAVVYHEVSASTGGTASAFKAYHKSRSRWQLLRRHVPTFQRPLAWLSVLGQELGHVALDLIKGRSAAARGRWHAWRDRGVPPDRYLSP